VTLTDHAPRRHLLPTLALLLFGGVCISWAPILVKVAARQDLGPTSIAFWRLLSGAVTLFAAAALTGRPLLLPPRLALLACLGGTIFTADLFLWHRSINLVGAGMATIFASTQVFNTAILNWVFVGEKPRGRFFFAAAVGLFGVALLAGIGSDIALSGDYLRGVLLGLGTGLAYGGYLLTTRHLGRQEPSQSPITIVAWLSLGGAASSGLICLFENDAFLPRTTPAWLSLVALGAGVQAAGWWAIATALPRVRGATGGLVLLLQPLLATVWGWLLFGERLAPLQLVGALLTLGAIYAGTLGLGRRPARDAQASRS
jgi:drug/metabolite transporter (DMT)-like permease